MSDAINKICDRAGEFQAGGTPASLFVDDKLKSAGLAILEKDRGSFHPTDGSDLDNLPPNARLRIASDERIHHDLQNFRRCQTGSQHYHFRF